MKVFIVAAMSANGFIARTPDDFSMDWTSPEDVKLFVKLTKEAGVMIMGSRTFATTVKAGRKLPGRKMVVYSSRPDEVHYDRKDPTEITSDPPAEVLKRLEAEGYTSVAVCGGPMIWDMFLDAGVVDEIYLSIEPILFAEGVPLLRSAKEKNLRLLDHENLNDNTLLMHYEVIK